MSNLPDSKHSRYRAIWISDVHLGTPACQARILLDFLRHNDSEYLYLVGDIIDGWRLSRRIYWPQEHNDVLQKLLRKARKGTKVIYVPGNHDEFLRDYVDMHFGGVEVLADTVHTTAEGKRLLVIHGDQFDGVVRYHKWLAHLGSWAYDMVVVLNTQFNRVRKLLGLPYWSLAGYLKRQVKEAGNFIAQFEASLTDAARESGADGVVCGHIHQARMKTVDGILYLNDGDWVESCTALVEHLDGRLELIHWPDPLLRADAKAAASAKKRENDNDGTKADKSSRQGNFG
jgi:UDP-2,3-diacylglucosamine pyrophosphatase LpxH